MPRGTPVPVVKLHVDATYACRGHAQVVVPMWQGYHWTEYCKGRWSVVIFSQILFFLDK